MKRWTWTRLFVVFALAWVVSLVVGAGAVDNGRRHDDAPVGALPSDTSGDAPVKRIKFGEKVAVDDVIGPVVINRDCTTSYIENWAELTREEKETTRRRLGARNRERHAACARAHGDGEL
jgi:hypothetical protein